jgi:hypothetical protein
MERLEIIIANSLTIRADGELAIWIAATIISFLFVGAIMWLRLVAKR